MARPDPDSSRSVPVAADGWPTRSPRAFGQCSMPTNRADKRSVGEESNDECNAKPADGPATGQNAFAKSKKGSPNRRGLPTGNVLADWADCPPREFVDAPRSPTDRKPPFLPSD